NAGCSKWMEYTVGQNPHTPSVNWRTGTPIQVVLQRKRSVVLERKESMKATPFAIVPRGRIIVLGRKMSVLRGNDSCTSKENLCTSREEALYLKGMKIHTKTV